MRSALRIVLAMSVLLAFGLAGCGVKGPLQPPPSAVANGNAPTGAGTPGTAPKKEAHRPFILDGLL